MGCRQGQERSADSLRQQLAGERSQLCQDCQQRFDRNIFRILDCKNPSCQRIIPQYIKGSPFLLCEACQAHFNDVRRGLTEAHVTFDDTKVFARGLDYYTRTVFEIRTKGLGAQDAVAAGGRYDNLVEELGGSPTGAIGFAAGIERALLALEALDQRQANSASARRGIYLAVAQSALLGEGFRLAQELRHHGVGPTMDYDGKSLKAQLREADKAHCRLVAILGEVEVKQRAMTLKDLEQGNQETISFERFVETVAQRLGTIPSSCS